MCSHTEARITVVLYIAYDTLSSVSLQARGGGDGGETAAGRVRPTGASGGGGKGVGTEARDSREDAGRGGEDEERG